MGAKRVFELYPGPLKKRMQARRKERWDLHQSEALEAATAAAIGSGPCNPAWSQLDLSSLEAGSPDLLKQAQALIASQEEHHGKAEREDRAKLLQDLEEHYKDIGTQGICSMGPCVKALSDLHSWLHTWLHSWLCSAKHRAAKLTTGSCCKVFVKLFEASCYPSLCFQAPLLPAHAKPGVD